MTDFHFFSFFSRFSGRWTITLKHEIRIEKFQFWSIFANFSHILWITNHVLKKVIEIWYFLNLHMLWGIQNQSRFFLRALLGKQVPQHSSYKQSFSDVRVRVRGLLWSPRTRTLKPLRTRTRTQRVCLFTHLYCKKVNISQIKSEISNFSFLKSYYSLYKPHAHLSTIVKTS
jgi:hypothetical protein